MQGFFRTFGLCFQNFDTAFRMSVIFVPNIIQYSGYLIPEFLMKRWLFWIYYINPFSYSWAGLMESEFSRISPSCEGSYVIVLPHVLATVTGLKSGVILPSSRRPSRRSNELKRTA